MHPRNKHQGRYDFQILIENHAELAHYVRYDAQSDGTIDFSDTNAVKALNKALLKTYYRIDTWDIPPHYLCPPIPGRADYIHHIADLLASSHDGKIPLGAQITGLDIGMGANCIYPIIGSAEYGWKFIGSDIDSKSLQNAANLIESNTRLQETVTIRKQQTSHCIFTHIIQDTDKIDFTMCNPPFHSSAKSAAAVSMRKTQNLTGKKSTTVNLNFGGQANELWCEGGELAFITRMIQESEVFSHQCLWFSTLVSKQEHVPPIVTTLKKFKVSDHKIIEMGQGNKVSRIIAWTYFSKEEQHSWAMSRW